MSLAYLNNRNSRLVVLILPSKGVEVGERQEILASVEALGRDGDAPAARLDVAQKTTDYPPSFPNPEGERKSPSDSSVGHKASQPMATPSEKRFFTDRALKACDKVCRPQGFFLFW